MGILDGRVAIVTGTSSAFGGACAQRFAQEGARVVCCGRRMELVDDRVAAIVAAGGEAIAVSCDVMEEEQIAAAVAVTVERFGRIDILGNFAQDYGPGRRVTDGASLADMTVDNLVHQFLGGPGQYLRFMQACFPYMREQGYGRIINTSSGAWLLGVRDFAAYGIVKAGVEALSRHASQEWGQHGIVTNTIYPIAMSPEQQQEHPDRTATFAQQIPLRYFGTWDDDVAPVVAFLASEGAGYVNGQSIGLNGGLYFT